MTETKSSPIRFLVFLLILAVLFAYIAFKWQRFNEETIGQGDPPIITLDGAEATGVESPEDVEPASGSALDSIAFNYYVEARMQRDKARSAQEAILREVINNPKSDTETRTTAQQELLQLGRIIGQESELEELIRAKGFQDVLVYLHDDAAVVIVRTEALTGEEVARIADIVNRFAQVPLQAMSIIPRNQ